MDTEATSETAFNENIHENNELFHSRYLNVWKLLVNHKLQQMYPNAIVSTLNNVASGQKSESDDSEEELSDEDNKIFRRINVSIISIINKKIYVVQHNAIDFFTYFIVVNSIIIILLIFIFKVLINVINMKMKKLLP